VKQMIIVFLAAFLLIAGQVVSAKGGDKVTISGGSLAHDVEVTDNACILNAFSDSNLEDLTTMQDHAPADLGTPYLITRSAKLLDGSYLPFDRVRFYTDPTGGLGYVHYLGMVDKTNPYSATAYDGMWFRPTAPTAAILMSLLGQPIPGTPAQAIISSPALPHDIQITSDLCTLSALAFGSLEDPTLRVSRAPQVDGSGYLITRYQGDQPYDQVRYFRDPRGGRGYVFDVGRVDGSSSENAGQWFRPTGQSDYVMSSLLLSPSSYVGNP